MQPVKMVIPGRYWDSFIYKGRLYLFGSGGDIRSIAWDEFISEWQVAELSRIAFVCAFQRSDYLYSADAQDLLADSEIKAVMREKFRILSNTGLYATESMLQRAEKGHQDNPLPFPHADLEMYMDKLYVGSAYGLFQTTCNKKTKYPVSVKPAKKWDGSVLSMSASYGSLALAAGSEGLYEFGLSTSLYEDRGKAPQLLSKIKCRDCSWAYFSVFASSDSSGYLAEFSKFRDGKYDREADRHFERIETAASIFGEDGYSWGIQDKLCQARRNSIKIVKYEPWSREEQTVRDLGSINFEPWKGDIVSAVTANFGMIVELENALVVFPSEGAPITIPGEPVNWRIFPRSRNYENQLHIIYEDRLEIFSFNQDYLVNQQEKLAGFSVFTKNRSRKPTVEPLLM